MRLSLKWRIAGAHALFSVLLIGALAAYVRQRVEESMVRELRDRLLSDCRVVWAVIESVPPADVQARVRELAPLMEARITLVRPDGLVLAESDAAPGTVTLHNTRPEVVNARGSGVGWARRYSSTTGLEMLYVAYSPGPNDPTVGAAMPLSEVQATTDAVHRTILSAAALAAAIAIGIGVLVAGRLARSLGLAAEVARRIGQGDLSARAPMEDQDDVGDLARALNTMAASLLQARAALERTASDLTSILSQMADGVLVVGADEQVRVLNPAARQLLAVGSGECVGRHFAEVVLHYELVDLTRRAVRLGATQVGELRTRGEPPTEVAAAAAPLHSASGALDGAVVTLRDITSLKLLQRQRTEFVTNASHELRTPTASVRALAEALESGAAEDPDLRGQFLTRIVENTERLGKLLDDLSALGRLDEGGPWLAPEAVSVSDLVCGAATRLETTAAAKGLTIAVDAIDETLHAWCCRDALMAAMTNLIENAVKYTPSGGVVRLSAGEEHDGRIRLTIADSGPGIAPEHRQRIFERFYRVDKGRSRELGGTGLGLSIVRHAVESSGGRVSVGDAPEGGAQFVVVLPPAKAH